MRMRNRKSISGFTLIELLTIVGTIGVLAAIAIPQYAEYRSRGFDARSQSDLRNAANAQEATFVDTDFYITCVDPCNNLPGFTNSPEVSISMTAIGSMFVGTSYSPSGSVDRDTLAESYVWDSSNGGLQP